MQISDFLICDDIRVEIGRKHSLIGLYDDSIVFNITPENVNRWPKRMRLSIFARIKIEEKDRNKKIHHFIVKVDYNGELRRLYEKELPTTNISQTPKINIVIVDAGFLFKEPGEIRFIIDFFDEKNNQIDALTLFITR